MATPQITANEPDTELPVPAYLLDHDDPAALFSRLQRVVIHLELLQSEAVQELPISFRDFVILATLRKEPPPHALAVSQIARYTLRPMGSISQGLDRVERAGYVSRSPSPEDRRKVIVALTPEGIRFADGALEAYDAIRQRVFRRLDDNDLDRIDTAVTDLLAALDADHLDAGGRHGAKEPSA